MGTFQGLEHCGVLRSSAAPAPSAPPWRQPGIRGSGRYEVYLGSIILSAGVGQAPGPAGGTQGRELLDSTPTQQIERLRHEGSDASEPGCWLGEVDVVVAGGMEA